MINLMDLPEELQVQIALKVKNFPDFGNLALTNSNWLRVCQTTAKNRLHQEQASDRKELEENRMEEDCDVLAMYHRSVKNRWIEQAIEYEYLKNFKTHYVKNKLYLGHGNVALMLAWTHGSATSQQVDDFIKQRLSEREKKKQAIASEEFSLDEADFETKEQELQTLASASVKMARFEHIDDIVCFGALHLLQAMMQENPAEPILKDALFSAIQQNADRLIQRLFQQFPEHIQHLDGQTLKEDYNLLTFSVRNGHAEILQLLLQKKIVNVNALDAHGLTPLHHCVIAEKERWGDEKILPRAQCAQMADLLLRHGADPQVLCTEKIDDRVFYMRQPDRPAESAWDMCHRHKTNWVGEVLSNHLQEKGLIKPSEAMRRGIRDKCTVS